MIHSIRRWHRWAVLVLAIVLPALLILGLVARPSFPRVPKLPEEPSESDLRTKLETVDALGLKVRFERSLTGKESGVLFVAPSRDILEPDVLLYWDEQGTPGTPPGVKAVLLGSIKGGQLRRLIVPKHVPDTAGSLVLYSSGHGRVLGVTPWQPVVSGTAK